LALLLSGRICIHPELALLAVALPLPVLELPLLALRALNRASLLRKMSECALLAAALPRSPRELSDGTQITFSKSISGRDTPRLTGRAARQPASRRDRAFPARVTPTLLSLGLHGARIAGLARVLPRRRRVVPNSTS